MDDGPGTKPASVGFFAGAWLLMMCAMMLPSVAPVVAAYAALRSSVAGIGHTVAGAGGFVAGYLATWGVVGLVAYGVEETLEAVWPLAWDQGGRYAAGFVLVVAAGYQLTPWKDRCLSRCRVPLSFMLSSWRDGVRGAAGMGVRYGVWCVGCCWAMFAALFALGFMSVLWMGVIALLITGEKLGPDRRSAALLTAVVLFGLGLAVALAPGSVPGLTVPGSM
jgi:predicted metal-binding membrane protein